MVGNNLANCGLKEGEKPTSRMKNDRRKRPYLVEMPTFGMSSLTDMTDLAKRAPLGASIHGHRVRMSPTVIPAVHGVENGVFCARSKLLSGLP